MTKSSFYSHDCFPEMWNQMKGKQIQPKKVHMTLPLTQHVTWSRHYALTRIRDSLAREHAITGPPGLSITTGLSGSSHSLMCLICSCTWPHRQSAQAALHAIKVVLRKPGAKNMPEGKAEALVADICHCSHGGKSQLEAPISSLTICFPL